MSDLKIKSLPSAEPEKRTEKRTETHACDSISRQAAIDTINELHDKPNAWLDLAVDALEKLPSAQPEFIYCKDCKYAEIADKEDNQDGYTCQFHRGSIWFSGSYCSWAERRTE